MEQTLFLQKPIKNPRPRKGGQQRKKNRIHFIVLAKVHYLIEAIRRVVVMAEDKGALDADALVMKDPDRLPVLMHPVKGLAQIIQDALR
jgi:hypothetical protein